MKKKDAKAEPQVCSGTYFPWRGRPQKRYYVVVDEVVVAGPFRSKRSATKLFSEKPSETIRRALNTRPVSLKRLAPSYARTIESVLRKQKKAVLAATRTKAS